jgi:beta-N-acetylhexosaminidase
VVLALVVLAIAGCGTSSDGDAGVVPTTTVRPEVVGPEGSTTSTAPSCLEQLTVPRMAALLALPMVVDGTDVSGMVDRVGGIGLVGPHRAASVAAIRAAVRTATPQPFLASDEEGGTVQRLRDVLGPLPSAARLAGTAPSEARATYDAYAAGMAGLGIDMNFAPTLAVGGRALGSRSYADDPEVVAERAGLFVDAMVGAGVLPVLKHFPGLGGVASNTDDAAAETAPLAELERRDLVPYRRLLDREPVAVMMSHARVPGLTGDLPASLSPAAYRYLADEYGFTGLVVTDSLGAGAVAPRWSLPDAAVLAVAAGADMVVFTDPPQLDAVLDALTAAVADGRIPADRIQGAAAAVLAARGADPCSLVGPLRAGT